MLELLVVSADDWHRLEGPTGVPVLPILAAEPHRLAQLATQRLDRPTEVVVVAREQSKDRLLRREDVRAFSAWAPSEDGTFVLPEDFRDQLYTGGNTLEHVIQRAHEVMSGYDRPWWIGGGWAVDAAVGRKTREHHDIDLIVLREDLPTLSEHLHGWDVRIAEPAGQFVRWDGAGLKPSENCLWARPEDEFDLSWQDFMLAPGYVEFLIEQTEDELWRYRRQPSITLPLAELGPRGTFLPLHVALLYKSKEPRLADQDFEVAKRLLTRRSRQWLRKALMIADSEHQWLQELSISP
ncbi:MAG TPA: hypothetical protein VNE62_03390 [Actinomycetota bacterium]|nr:hypothetical protein [Actinomycetota bacterium]